MFHILAAEKMGLRERIGLLRALSQGRFRGLPKTYSWYASKIRLNVPFPLPIELDGEIVEAEEAEFSVLPNALRVCI
jgi:diacylglycerol kinase family enzyme